MFCWVLLNLKGVSEMSDRNLAIEEKEAVEQVSAYLKMLTPEQQQTFATLIQGAMVTMQVVGRKDNEQQNETA